MAFPSGFEPLTYRLGDMSSSQIEPSAQYIDRFEALLSIYCGCGAHNFGTFGVFNHNKTLDLFFRRRKRCQSGSQKSNTVKKGFTFRRERDRSIQKRHKIARFSHKSCAKGAVFAFAGRKIGRKLRPKNDYGAGSGAKCHFHCVLIANFRTFVWTSPFHSGLIVLP